MSRIKFSLQKSFLLMPVCEIFDKKFLDLILVGEYLILVAVYLILRLLTISFFDEFCFFSIWS